MLDMLLSNQSGGAQIQELARTFGLGENQVQSALEQMVPALSQGVKNNISSTSGLESLSNALQRGDHQKYVDHPETLSDEQSLVDGNNILGHILGSKDVSRAVADQASANTGLESGMLKKMLPLVATMMMGTMSKQASSNNLLGGLDSSGGAGGGMLEMLGGMLDADKDGSAVDDIIGMAGKLFK